MPVGQEHDNTPVISHHYTPSVINQHTTGSDPSNYSLRVLNCFYPPPKEHIRGLKITINLRNNFICRFKNQDDKMYEITTVTHRFFSLGWHSSDHFDPLWHDWFYPVLVRRGLARWSHCCRTRNFTTRSGTPPGSSR